MVRDIENKDIGKCLEIYNYYIENTAYTLEEKCLTYGEFGNRVNDIKKDFPYLVYESEEGEVLGYAYLYLFHERSAYRKTVDLSIYVSKDHLHEGIGKKLLDDILVKSMEKGYRVIVSIVTSANPNSLSFHLKNGFVLEATLKNVARKFNKDISTYYLLKRN